MKSFDFHLYVSDVITERQKYKTAVIIMNKYEPLSMETM